MDAFIRIIITALMIAVLLGSCKKQQDFDKETMLNELVTGYAIPAYSQLLLNNQNLEATCIHFINQPTTTNLIDLQNNWKETMRTWSTVELLVFGPGETSYRYFQLDNTPINANSIENSIADTVLIDSTYMTKRSGYTKGLASIEYLLFDENQVQQTILDQYQTGINKQRRADYLLYCIKNTKGIVQDLHDDWSLTYGTTLSKAVDNGLNGGIALFSNAIIHLSQTIARKKMGKPLGKESNDQLVHLEYLESPYAYFTWDIILHNLNSIQQIFGEKDKGLGSYLTYLVNDAQLAENIRNQMTKIEGLIKARTASLKEDLSINTADVEEIYQEVKLLYEMLNSNIAAYFSISVLTNPDDGD